MVEWPHHCFGVLVRSASRRKCGAAHHTVFSHLSTLSYWPLRLILYNAALCSVDIDGTVLFWRTELRHVCLCWRMFWQHGGSQTFALWRGVALMSLQFMDRQCESLVLHPHELRASKALIVSSVTEVLYWLWMPLPSYSFCTLLVVSACACDGGWLHS